MRQVLYLIIIQDVEIVLSIVDMQYWKSYFLRNSILSYNEN